MQIVPGVYQLNGSPYGRFHNGYLVHDGDTTIMIDSGDIGMQSCLPEIEHNAARWGFSIDQVSHLFLTHEHFDHASHAAAIQRRGVRVIASPTSAEAMAAGDARCLGWINCSTFEPCTADDVVRDGEERVIGGLAVRCIAAPGHCDGAVIYEIELNDEICWFVGDLVMTRLAHDGTDLGWTGAIDFDRAKAVQTLQSLVEMPCDHLFPGHGIPAIGCARNVLAAALSKALVEWR